MIRTKMFVTLAMLAAISAGCENMYKCTTCTQIPEALPADDNAPTGVYKGVLVGETTTGTIKATIATDESAGSCAININGEVMTSTGFSIGTGSVIYTFTGERFVFDLEVDATGTIIATNLIVDSEPVIVVLAKEVSDTLVECFEGTWTGEYTGVWNVVIAGDKLDGRYDGDSSGNFIGTISNNSLTITMPSGTSLATGHRNEDQLSGDWDYYGVTGTWSGRRTM